MTTAMVKRIGLFGGPLLGLLCYYLLPPHYATAPGEWVEFTQAGRATLALMVWMAGWWLTEAVDIEATALLPIVTFPLLGIAPLNKVLPPYAAEVIFLFMGGFIIGLAIERWGLDRRIAFFILRLVGARPSAIVGGFMAVTAFLSMWVSNTACAAMMVPIALSVVDLVLRTRTGAGLKESGGIPQDRIPERNFATGLLLCIAYAASIGGIATIIGSPPNGIAVRYIQQTFGKEVSFFDWLLVGGPFTLIFLPIAWLLVTRVLFRADIGEIKGGREHFDEEYQQAGPPRPGREDRAGSLFCHRLSLDMQPAAQGHGGRGREAACRALRHWHCHAGGDGAVRDPRRSRQGHPSDGLAHGRETPVGRSDALRRRAHARNRHRDERSVSIHRQLEPRPGWPAPLLLLLAITTMTVFLSELTSNTAQVATMVPVLAAMSPALGMNPYVLILACTLGASSAYMMPVGTPPNAIVFGTGLVRLPQMMKAGFWLNLAGILLITALVTLFITPLLGNEGWQSSKVHEGYSRGAHQGQASMQRMGGPDER